MNPWDFFSGNPERDRRNFMLLMQTLEELLGVLDLAEVRRRGVDRAILLAGAERGILLLDEGEGPEPVVARDASGEDVPLDVRYSSGVVKRVIESGEAYMTIDAAGDQAASLGKSIVDLRLLSIMATPLSVKGRTIGVLYVDSTVHAKEFTPGDFQFFQTLGQAIALAVDRSRLLEEQREKERMEGQLALAHDIQRRLLPENISVPVGFDVAGLGRPCEETSGDYYDVIPRDDGRLALVVGDVSGHGIGPALYMASTRALIHALMATGADPVHALGTVNRFLSRDMPDNAFMSLFLGVLDPDARTLEYASAGHNPPLVLRTSGDLEELPRTGPVLAAVDDAPYRLSEALSLSAGDVVVLYTDGIFEARGPGEEMYGEDRLRASLARHGRDSKSASGILDGLLGDLDLFRSNHRLDDDITCLVLRAVSPS